MKLLPVKIHTMPVDVSVKQLYCVCFAQEPTPITAMELSTKQVKTCFHT